MSSKPTPGSVGQNLTLASFSAQRSFMSRDAMMHGTYKAAIVKQATATIRNLFGKGVIGDAFEGRESSNSLVPHPTQ